MKICYNCKSQVNDEVVACPYCNGQQFVPYGQVEGYSNMQNPQYSQNYENVQNQQYSQGYENVQNQQYGQSYEGMQNQQYSQNFGNAQNGQYNQGYGNVQSGQYNQGYGNIDNQQYNQGYSNMVDPYYQQVSGDNPPKGNKRKAPLIVLISVIMLCLIGGGVYMALFGVKRIKAQSTVKKYTKAIENFDAEGILYSMVPKEVLDKEFSFFGPTDTLYNGSLDEALKEINEELDKMKGDLKIDFKNVKVGNPKKLDLENQVINYAKRLKDEFPQADMDDLNEEVNELIEEVEKLGIDTKKIWIADFEFKISITADMKKMVGVDMDLKDMTFSSEDLGINHVYLYEYNGKMYVIPGVEDMIFAPLIKPLIYRIL